MSSSNGHSEKGIENRVTASIIYFEKDAKVVPQGSRTVDVAEVGSYINDGPNMDNIKVGDSELRANGELIVGNRNENGKLENGTHLLDIDQKSMAELNKHRKEKMNMKKKIAALENKDADIEIR